LPLSSTEVVSARTRWLADAAQEAGARVVALPGPHERSYPRVLASFLAGHRVDVLHWHAGWGWEDDSIARVADEADVPALVLTHHFPFLLHKRSKADLLRTRTGRVDARIAVSEGQRASYLRLGIPESGFATVPNGVRPRGPGPGRTRAREALGLADDDLVVMTVGRLTNMKGQRYLVEAAAMLRPDFPRLKVVVIGDGELRPELESLVLRHGLQDVVLLPGHREDARQLLDAADVFALSSTSEGMPLVLLEAMDAGLPVVATRIIGAEEVVLHEETGLVAPPKNADALAEALRRLLADPDRRAAYGAAGRRRYVHEFTARRMADRTWAVYEDALERAGHSVDALASVG